MNIQGVAVEEDGFSLTDARRYDTTDERVVVSKSVVIGENSAGGNEKC